VLCDFNGTIVDRDMLDFLASTTNRDAEGAPLQLEGGYRTDISRRARALCMDRDEAERRIEGGIHFDDTFPAFERACVRANIEILILTSGIQELVARYLALRNVFVPVIGNTAEIRPDGWLVQFRDDSPAGIDKRGFVERFRQERRSCVVVGDDRSDFEAALAADVVYAKSDSALERYLMECKRAFRPFRRFADILDRWPPHSWSREGRDRRE
jgi:2-hydroxy-3-keto-5-methylthiopentenyl-1-phosphate phosphatase